MHGMSCHAMPKCQSCMKDEVGVTSTTTTTGCYYVPAGEKEENGLREF